MGRQSWFTGRRVSSLVAVAFTASACTAEVVDSDPAPEPIGSVQQPIQGGSVDEGDPAVVGVALTNDSGRIYKTCSGSLIAPNLVLTAQHCVANTPKSVSCGSAIFGDAAAPAHVLVTTDPWMWHKDTVWHGVESVRVPPGFPAVCGRDVALIILDEPLRIDPLTPRLDDTLRVGQRYDAIGYGRTSEGTSDGGTRRKREGLTVACVPGDCDAGHVVGGEWRGSAGICSGDSGGPAIDASGRIIGVTSRGPSGCDDPIYGGLAPWSGWLEQVSSDAAILGAYPRPQWSNAEASFPLRAQLGTGAGCSASPRGDGHGYGVLITGVIIGLAFTRRRLGASSRS